MSAFQHNTLPHLGLKHFAPSAKLAPYVQCYWFIQCASADAAQTSEYLHPDGGMSLTFNYSDNLTFDNGYHASDCILDGAHTTTRAMHLKGQFNVVGIRFLPTGARAFLAIPLNELKSQLISITDIPNVDVNQLYEQLGEAVSYADKVVLIENWLLSNMRPEQQTSDVIRASLQFLDHHYGDVNITAMADRFNVNKRKLERLFNEQVGLTAKEYARNQRIKHARFYLKKHSELSLAEIAYELGFYDQAHFSKQFKQVVGISPKAYHVKSQQQLTP
jgi:AraC-like DNA-binding protein